MGSFVRRQQSSRTGYFLSICTVPRVEKVVYPAGPSPEDAKTTASDIQLRDQHDDASHDSEQIQEYLAHRFCNQ